MKAASFLGLLVVVALVSAASASGQSDHASISPRVGVQALENPLRPDNRRPEPRAGLRRNEIQGSLGVTLISTVAFGVIGGLAGGAVGDALGGEGTCGDSDCGFVPMLMVGMVGIALGTGVGAHIGNGSRGSLGLDILGGAIGTAIGVGLLAAGGGDGPGLALFVPIPILLIPALFERSGARRNYRERVLSAAVAPAPGGLAIALTARW